MDKNALHLQKIPGDKKSINALFRLLDIDFPMLARILLCLLRVALKAERLNAVYLTDGLNIYGYTIYKYVADLNAVHLRNGYKQLPDFKFSNFGFNLQVMVNFEPGKRPSTGKTS